MSARIQNVRRLIDAATAAIQAEIALDLAASKAAIMGDFASIDGGEKVGVKRIEVGARARTLADKAGESVTSDDFEGATDTARMQAALNAVANGGNGQRRVTFSPGAYTLEDQGGYSLKVGSDTLLDGGGSKLTQAGVQTGYMIQVAPATNTTVTNMHLVATAISGDNDAKAGIIFSAHPTLGGGDSRNLKATFNYLRGTSWGIHGSWETATWRAYGVLYMGNMVESDEGGQRGNDPFHIAGAYEGARMIGNYARNRGDAAFALTSTAAHNGGGAVVVGNVGINCNIGSDAAGVRRAAIVGNVLANTIANETSNPAGRIIPNEGASPEDIVVVGNIFLTNSTASDDVDYKIIGLPGADVHVNFSSNITRRLFIQAQRVTVAANTFKSGGVIRIDVGSKYVFIGTNTFEDDCNIFMPGAQGLAGPIYIAPQACNAGFDVNFMANTNLWMADTVLQGAKAVRSNIPQASTQSNSPYIIPGGSFEVHKACLFDGISALADLSSHPGYIDLLDSDGRAVITYYVPCVPGQGATGAVPYPVDSVTGGPAVHVRLLPGVYRLALRVQLGTISATINEVRTWGA